jgi:multidrug transporter EmrE-like cation transporter
MAFEVPPPEAAPVVAGASSRSSLISAALLIVSVVLATAGQLTLKAAMSSIGRIGTAQVNDAGQTVFKAVKEPLLWIGLALFGLSAMFWLVVLSRVDLSIAYPLVGVSYIVIVSLARFIFHEHVPTLRWMGVSLIALGIALVGVSSRTVAGN